MKKRPSIAMIGQIGGGLFGNGVPVFFNMVSAVCEQFDVEFFSLMIVDDQVQKRGLTVHSISKRKWPLHFKYALLLTKLFFRHIKNPFNVIYAVSAFPAGRMAIVLGWILRRPVVIQLIVDEMVSMPEIGYGQLLNPKFRRVNKWVCRNAAVLVVLTKYQGKIVSDNLNFSRSIQAMSWGIDITKFPYHDGSLEPIIQFVHVGYYRPVKDHATLFQAYAQLAKRINCKLTVVGSGFDNREVHDLLCELSLTEKVHFIGSITHDKLSEVFSNKHILLHTSRYEAECAVIMEAMASGVVVCGTRVGFLADHEELAVVVPPANPAELSSAVLKLIQEPARYELLKVKARKYIEEHSSEWTGGEYISLFNRLTKHRQEKS